MFSELIDSLDKSEELLMSAYKSLGDDMTQARMLGNNDAYSVLEIKRVQVGSLLHLMREFMRDTAPELYPDF